MPIRVGVSNVRFDDFDASPANAVGAVSALTFDADVGAVPTDVSTGFGLTLVLVEMVGAFIKVEVVEKVLTLLLVLGSRVVPIAANNLDVVAILVNIKVLSALETLSSATLVPVVVIVVAVVVKVTLVLLLMPVSLLVALLVALNGANVDGEN